MSTLTILLCDGTSPDGSRCSARHEVSRRMLGAPLPPGWWSADLVLPAPPPPPFPKGPNPFDAGGPFKEMLDAIGEMKPSEVAPRLLETITKIGDLLNMQGPPALFDALGQARAQAEQLVNSESMVSQMVSGLLDKFRVAFETPWPAHVCSDVDRMVSVQATYCGAHPAPEVRADLVNEQAGYAVPAAVQLAPGFGV